jgi:hypothetical protein
MRLEPGVLRQLAFGVPEAIHGGAAGATGILPFRLGRQPIAVGVEVAFPGVQVVAGCQPFQLRTLVAKAGSVGPLRPLDRILRVFPLGGIDAQDLFVEFLCHRILVEVKRADRDTVQGFIGSAGAVAHGESASHDQDHLTARLGLEDGQGLDVRPIDGGPARVVLAAAGNDGNNRDQDQ